MSGWGLLGWRGEPWRTSDTPLGRVPDTGPWSGLRSWRTTHLPPGADMTAGTTYYRLGNGDRIVAATTPAPPPRRPALPAADVARVHPLALQAALDLAEGDTSRLVFTPEGTVEVRNAPRGSR